MGSTPISDQDLLEQRFLRALRHLVATHQPRGVIRLVERWAEHGVLSTEVRIQEAEAFLSLKLMDRAWVRLREAAEGAPEDRHVKILTAEMFVGRGWHHGHCRYPWRT